MEKNDFRPRNAGRDLRWPLRIAFLLFALICFPVAVSTAQAQTGLLDGGFDQQAASVGQNCYFSNASCPTGAWSGVSHAGLLAQNGWDNEIAPSQTHFAFVQWDGTLQQTFTASATGQYKVGWWAAGRGGGQGTEQYHVEINGQNLGTFQSTSSSAFIYLTSASVALVVGQSYTLKFVGETNADQAVYIDSVSLVPVGADGASYTYDALGRLVAVENSNGYAAAYRFDQASNRKQVLVGGN